MCGICGFIHKAEIEDKYLKAMNDKISYRGPNDEGIYLQKMRTGWQLGLAHKRLSILDLSMAGHQPMLSDDSTIVVCYNGEIYNYLDIRNELMQLGYKFHSNCDTEVIIYAYKQWGINCVSKFNGMFSISLYDRNTDDFYLVRDRMGVKPLYYYAYHKGLVFASELKPIMSYPYFKKEINQNALGIYLSNQYIPGTQTIFQNTFKLLPGSVLHWKDGKIKEEKYWSVEEKYRNRVPFDISYEDAVDKLQELLRDAVAKRMISDVPLGAFLSGGYDSTLIAAIMQEQSKRKIKTFTIGFQEDKYNEAPYAEKVAKSIGTEHYCEYLPLSDARRIIEDIPIYYDEPMADASQVATMLLSKITKQKVTVALSGDAGDELFGGYTKYAELKRFEKYKYLSKVLNSVEQIIPMKERMPRLINKLFYFDSIENIINADAKVFWDRHAGLLSDVPNNEEYQPIMSLSSIPEEKYMLYDMITYLPDDILTKVDRASMSVSLEARTPFLDYRIVEFALSLPLEYKMKDGNQKRILKDVAYKYVDRRFLERPKQGFGVPVKEWMKEDFKGFTKGFFDKTYIDKQGIFDYQVVNKMVKLFLSGNDNKVADNLWTLLVFQMWWDRYMI